MTSQQKITPSVLPGFMDLLPKEQIAFNTMLRKIQASFELFGYKPMDTPIIEKAEILLAKGGEESERQTYAFKKGDNDLALRFDLTVPLARFVSEHLNELTFPFKRYQIGKVYRGEKPQKGRFREFYQCDVDIIDKDSLDLINDAEILNTIYFTFKKLEIGKFLIKVNNRKVLNGFMQSCDLGDNAKEVLRLIDKLDKIGDETLIKELHNIGLNTEIVDKIMEFIRIRGNASKTLEQLESLNITVPLFTDGINELKQFVNYLDQMQVPQEFWTIDLAIARGLDYYTGTVYETVLVDYPEVGSICSGGRYDNLADYYTNQKLPGVGISIGLTRLFYQLNEMGLISKPANTTAKVLIVALGNHLDTAFEIANSLRQSYIPTEVYTDNSQQFRKKLDYANKNGIPYVGIIGDDEIANNVITLKDMQTGQQSQVKLEELVNNMSHKS